MGDMSKIIDQAIADLKTAGMMSFLSPRRRSRIEAILWKVWEAAYQDGYGDGQEDADVEVES